MKQKLSILSLILLFTWIPMTFAGVIIKSTMGQVVFQKAGTQKWEKARINTILNKGDLLLTKAKSSAVIIFLDNTGMVSLSENSKLLISENEKKTDKTPSFLLFLGNIKGKITKKQDTPIDFATPTAVVGVRGTEFVIAVAEEGTARVGVEEGVVAVAGLSSEVTLNAGEASTVPLAGEPEDKVAYSSKEDFASWLNSTKQSVKGKEREVLERVEKALEYNYSQIDLLQEQSEANIKRVEALKAERADLLAKGDPAGAENKGNEALSLIGERTRIILQSHNIDFKNQAIMEIGTRIAKTTKKNKEIQTKYSTIKKRFDLYHSKFILTKQKKGCLSL